MVLSGVFLGGVFGVFGGGLLFLWCGYEEIAEVFVSH